MGFCGSCLLEKSENSTSKMTLLKPVDKKANNTTTNSQGSLKV